MKLTRVTPALAAVLLVGAIGALTPARADEFPPGIPDRGWIDLGATSAEVRTDVAVSGAAGVGAVINFEEIFNLPGNKTTARMLGSVRVSEHRRHVDFGFVDINRSGSRVITEDITFGDYTFLANGTVTAGFNTSFIYGAYRYDFLHTDQVRISGSAGLSWTDIGASLSGDGTFNSGGAPVPGTYSSDASIAAPVPLIGMNLDWAITKTLALRWYSRFFRINVSELDGGMYESGVHLDWYFTRHFGLGAAWDRTELKINSVTINTDDVGKFSYVVAGVSLNLCFAF